MEHRRLSDVAWWHIPHLVPPALRVLASVPVFTALAWLVTATMWGGHLVLGIALAGLPLITLSIAWPPAPARG